MAALNLDHIMQGIGKSVIFAVWIALVAVVNGLAVTGGAEQVGRATTRTVVHFDCRYYRDRHVVHFRTDAWLMAHTDQIAIETDGTSPVPSGDDPLIIEVTDLVTHYPGNPEPTLKGVSMRIYPNEIVCIMGGSGSGKSTLLRQIMALDTPTAGTVRILGQDLAGIGHREMHELRKKIGVAFQGGAMFNSMTVGENLKLPLREHAKLAEEQMDIMVRMKLAFVNLDPNTANKLPSELSGGMLKRAAMARAIMMDPGLLFCDEPSAGLDPAVSAALDDLILKIA